MLAFILIVLSTLSKTAKPIINTSNYTCLDVCDQVCAQMQNKQECYMNCPCTCNEQCNNLCQSYSLGIQCQRKCGCKAQPQNQKSTLLFEPNPQVPNQYDPQYNYEEYMIINHPTAKCIKECQNKCFSLNPTDSAALLICLNECSSLCSPVNTTSADAAINISPIIPIANSLPLPNMQLIVDSSSNSNFNSSKYVGFFASLILILAIVAMLVKIYQKVGNHYFRVRNNLLGEMMCS